MKTFKFHGSKDERHQMKLDMLKEDAFEVYAVHVSVYCPSVACEQDPIRLQLISALTQTLAPDKLTIYVVGLSNEL